jgi:hypothetical protein
MSNTVILNVLNKLEKSGTVPYGTVPYRYRTVALNYRGQLDKVKDVLLIYKIRHVIYSTTENFRKSRLDMDTDNGLPYESVPPVLIRT